MRRTALNSLFVFSLTALAAVLSACATSPVDENLGGLTQDQTPTTTDESTKLPASASLPKDHPTADAGDSTLDAGADATAPKPDATTPPNPPTTPPGNTSACPDKSAYHIKFLASGSTSNCPCSASECCYNLLGCISL